MQIGNNKYTNSNKKAYRKPELEVVEMDVEMRLIMMSPDTPPDDPGDGEPELTSSFPDTPNYDQTYPKKESPFGGGTPDYQR